VQAPSSMTLPSSQRLVLHYMSSADGSFEWGHQGNQAADAVMCCSNKAESQGGSKAKLTCESR
jgi:hypothetical protein